MTNPNDPAHPTQQLHGLTKREYFAAQALRGAIEWHGYNEDPLQTTVENIARDCVAMADALLAELSK